jgi:GH18 family chitinase
MTNWAQYRPKSTKYTPSDVDPFLCTHIIYAFAAINDTTNKIRAFEWNDESTEYSTGRYEELNNLKLANPNLKTLLAVGGNNRLNFYTLLIDILYFLKCKVGIWDQEFSLIWQAMRQIEEHL